MPDARGNLGYGHAQNVCGKLRRTKHIWTCILPAEASRTAGFILNLCCCLNWVEKKHWQEVLEVEAES